MSEQKGVVTRQWIPMAGGSCDVRMGYGALDQSSKLFRSSVGSPRLCVAVVREEEDDALVELLRRQLTDAGFEVIFHSLKGRYVRTLEEAARLFSLLSQAHATSDDMCCAMGDADVLSLAAYVCASWCNGMSLVTVPLNEMALLEGTVLPKGLDLGKQDQMIRVAAHARHALVDFNLALSPLQSEQSQQLRAAMVAAGMAGSERAFSELWDRADAIMAGDEEALTKQMMATAKARGQAATSTAVAIRQSVEYGEDIARSMRVVVDASTPWSVLVAEGMKFAARLSVTMGKLQIDDMLAQDELLDALGLGTVCCNVEPLAFVKALKDQRFLRTNRFMLLVPQAVGRVRLTSVADDTLLEHAQAWCAAHAE